MSPLVLSARVHTTPLPFSLHLRPWASYLKHPQLWDHQVRNSLWSHNSNCNTTPSFRCLVAYIHLLAVCLVLGPFPPCVTVYTLMLPQTRGLMCSPFSTAPLPLAAHPALPSSPLYHFLTCLPWPVLFLLQGLPHALGPLWGAGSPHVLSPSSLPSLCAQCVPGSSQQASCPLLAAGRHLLRFLTLRPIAQGWTSPPPPSLSCPRQLT